MRMPSRVPVMKVAMKPATGANHDPSDDPRWGSCLLALIPLPWCSAHRRTRSATEFQRDRESPPPRHSDVMTVRNDRICTRGEHWRARARGDTSSSSGSRDVSRRRTGQPTQPSEVQHGVQRRHRRGREGQHLLPTVLSTGANAQVVVMSIPPGAGRSYRRGDARARGPGPRILLAVQGSPPSMARESPVGSRSGSAHVPAGTRQQRRERGLGRSPGSTRSMRHTAARAPGTIHRTKADADRRRGRPLRPGVVARYRPCPRPRRRAREHPGLRPAPLASGGAAERVAAIRRAGLVAGGEPLLALDGRPVSPGLGADAAPASPAGSGRRATRPTRRQRASAISAPVSGTR